MKMSKIEKAIEWLDKQCAKHPPADYQFFNFIKETLNQTNGVITPHACWFCNGNLIWGGDHSFEDYGVLVDDETGKGDGVIANLQCTDCGASAYFLTAPDEGHQQPEIF